MPQLSQLHGEVVTEGVYFDLAVKFHGRQPELHSVRDNRYHGVRVYFGLTSEQKVEIATVNNTAIAVPNDLLDRMREQLLGSELRDWCQSVGLLGTGKDFSDRRSPDLPTVRLARTLILNFYRGHEAPQDGFHQPILSKSGGSDDAYINIRNKN